jgi:DNA-binding NarL/FixJ family response regulator
MKRPVRVLIVDDHTIVREGFHMLLGDESMIDIVGDAVNGVDALRYARLMEPDVVLMDVGMPEMDGITATRLLRESCPRTHVIMLTSFAGDQRVQEALRSGAIGYVLKDVPKGELVQAILAAAHGKPQTKLDTSQSALGLLTERERDVLRLIARGRPNKEIAAELHLTEGTVKGYVSTVLAKLEVTDRTQAALYAVRHGLT